MPEHQHIKPNTNDKIKTMNTIGFRHLLILICLSILLGAGCDKDDNNLILELEIGSDSAEISRVIKGIEFKFCLLNEKGEATTLLKEGDKFSFQFSYKNVSGEMLNLDNNILANNSFCEVLNTSQSFGQPFIYLGKDKIGAGAFPFENGKEYTIEFPWINENKVWRLLSNYFKNSNNEILPSGQYYTEFSQAFVFPKTVDDEPLKIDSITFKINFNIK